MFFVCASLPLFRPRLFQVLLLLVLELLALCQHPHPIPDISPKTSFKEFALQDILIPCHFGIVWNTEETFGKEVLWERGAQLNLPKKGSPTSQSHSKEVQQGIKFAPSKVN